MYTWMLHFSTLFWFKERSEQGCFIHTELFETLKMGLLLVETWNGFSWNMNGVGRTMFKLAPIHNYMAQNQATPPYLA